jgi:hypothetical protein
MMGITHRVAEERSIALHTEVARRLLARPELLDRARDRVAGWSRDGSVARCWVDAWTEVLQGSLGEVVNAITDPSEQGHNLRQTSPFAGVIDAQTRWHILRRCEQQRRAHDP